jgi:hypothetical protein
MDSSGATGWKIAGWKIVASLPDQLWGPASQPSIQRVLGTISPVVKLQEREADDSSTTPPHAIRA